MKRGIISALILSLMACTAPKQERQQITLTVNDSDDRKLMLSPMGNDEGITEMTVDGNTFRADMPTSATGFYNLISIKDNHKSCSRFTCLSPKQKPRHK